MSFGKMNTWIVIVSTAPVKDAEGFASAGDTALTTVHATVSLPVETGVFSGTAPDEYVVITPLADTFGAHSDNRPGFEVQEARISLFTKGNYQQRKRHLNP